MNNEKNSINEEAATESNASRPRDDRFADPSTDADPRTSDEGVTSVGASDLNADDTTQNSDSPEAVPGVRRG